MLQSNNCSHSLTTAVTACRQRCTRMTRRLGNFIWSENGRNIVGPETIVIARWIRTALRRGSICRSVTATRFGVIRLGLDSEIRVSRCSSSHVRQRRATRLHNRICYRSSTTYGLSCRGSDDTCARPLLTLSVRLPSRYHCRTAP